MGLIKSQHHARTENLFQSPVTKSWLKVNDFEGQDLDC